MTSVIVYQEEWVRILNKGLITIPKNFREELGIKEGEVAKMKKIGKRLIIEPRYIADYELYSNQELKKMLAEDKLSGSLADKAAELWSDLR